MAKHMWVEFQYTVIEPELLPDGTIHVYAREAAIEAAFFDAKQGCWICYAPLTADTIDEECPGGQDG